MANKILKKVRPDSKGTPLGRIAEGVSSYTVTTAEHGKIILEPNIEIPAREQWLWENKAALKQVKKGLLDSASGKVKSRGNFEKFVDEDE